MILFRRHTKACIRNYPQAQRIYRPLRKRDEAKDCECPIYTEGVLSKEGRISNRSTQHTAWDEAEKVILDWQKWGQTMSVEADNKNAANVTIQYAIDEFLVSRQQVVSPKTLGAYQVLLRQRLLPYSASQNYTFLGEYNNLHAVTQFVQSWRNLQPTRNRKDVEMPEEEVFLNDTTKRTELQRLRLFFGYCVERPWGLEKNHAKNKQLRVKTKTDPKYGMEPDEVERFFDGIARSAHDPRSDPQRLRVFCLVMRHAGLRISDATRLHDRQLVHRASGKGWAIYIPNMKKTDDDVYIPIPEFVAQELQRLDYLAEKDDRHYWFWTANGGLDTATDNWYSRIRKVVLKVAEETPFRHPVSPHTFRHTFAISHLNAGTEIKFVSRWLGHSNSLITEKHYGHATEGTKIASEDAYDASLRRQEAALENRRIAKAAMTA